MATGQQYRSTTRRDYSTVCIPFQERHGHPYISRNSSSASAACRGIQLVTSDTMERATPILFMRAPDGVLFRVAEAHRSTAFGRSDHHGLFL
jgi:hypothetical protein